MVSILACRLGSGWGSGVAFSVAQVVGAIVVARVMRDS
jgi:hypothetical protein